MADRFQKRNIRAHEFEENNFDVSFTDSTSPFTAIINQIKEPGKSYNYAYASDERLIKLFSKGWSLSDPEKLPSYNRFSLKKRDLDDTPCIRVGDTVLVERAEQFSKQEKERHHNDSAKQVANVLQTLKTTTDDVWNPFSGPSIYGRR